MLRRSVKGDTMPGKVIALVEDPFWRTKIDNAARSVGASTVFLSDPAGVAPVIEPAAPVAPPLAPEVPLSLDG